MENSVIFIPSANERLSDEQEFRMRSLAGRAGYGFVNADDIVSGLAQDVISFFAPGSGSVTCPDGPACIFTDGAGIHAERLDPSCPDESMNLYLSPLSYGKSLYDFCSLNENRMPDPADVCCCPAYDDEDDAGFSGLFRGRRKSSKRVCGTVPDNAVPKPSRTSETESIEALVRELQNVKEEKLRSIGISEETLRFLLGFRKEPSRMNITRHSDILLCDYGNMEISMDDKTKALYFLYLRHSEGIAIKDLSSHREELLSIYQKISGRDDPEAMRRTVENLTDPFRNDVNISLSRIKKAFASEMSDMLARSYYVTGERGGLRSVAVDRSLVTWGV